MNSRRCLSLILALLLALDPLLAASVSIAPRPARPDDMQPGCTYDPAYRLDLVTWTHVPTQQLVAQFDCTVNALGLRTQIVETVRQPQSAGGGLDTTLVKYEYDLLGRLTRETRTRGAQTIVDTSYDYDLFGNRTKVTNHLGPSEQTAAFNNLHQLITDGNLSFTYDASGNLYEKKQGQTVQTRYEYDFLNRLSKVTNNPGQGETWQTYEYDAGGGLIKVTSSSGVVKRFVNDHQNVTGFHQALVELDAQSGVLATMTYGLDLVRMTRSGEYYYIYDPLGSTRALTSASGQVTDTYLYDAYGNLIAVAGSTENPYLFTGERFDPATGFYYLRARFYSPSTGRFTQLDTFLGSSRDPRSLHRYLYCAGDPANYVDPTGLEFNLVGTLTTCGIQGLLSGTIEVAIARIKGEAPERIAVAFGRGFAIGAITAGVFEGITVARGAYQASRAVAGARAAEEVVEDTTWAVVRSQTRQRAAGTWAARMGAAGEEAVAQEILARGEQVVARNVWFVLEDGAGNVVSSELDLVTNAAVHEVKNYNWWATIYRNTKLLEKRVFEDWGKQIRAYKTYLEGSGWQREVELWVSKVPEKLDDAAKIEQMITQFAEQHGIRLNWYTPLRP